MLSRPREMRDDATVTVGGRARCMMTPRSQWIAGVSKMHELCLVLSCLVLSCLVLSCLVLSCLILSCLVLSCLVLSCLLPCLLQLERRLASFVAPPAWLGGDALSVAVGGGGPPAALLAGGGGGGGALLARHADAALGSFVDSVHAAGAAAARAVAPLVSPQLAYVGASGGVSALMAFDALATVRRHVLSAAGGGAVVSHGKPQGCVRVESTRT